MIEALFDSIDKRDAERFGDLLHDDCVFRFGNQAPVAGKDAVIACVAGFFESIGGIRHALADRWDVDGAVLCHGQVTYTRRDGSELEVPFANVLKLDGGKIREYLIFVDNTALYAG